MIRYPNGRNPNSVVTILKDVVKTLKDPKALTYSNVGTIYDRMDSAQNSEAFRTAPKAIRDVLILVRKWMPDIAELTRENIDSKVSQYQRRTLTMRIEAALLK